MASAENANEENNREQKLNWRFNKNFTASIKPWYLILVVTVVDSSSEKKTNSLGLQTAGWDDQFVRFEPYQKSNTVLQKKYSDLGLEASVILQYADVLQADHEFLVNNQDFFTVHFITSFPPDNANEDNTDEDSGKKDNALLHNLPGGQLRAETEPSAEIISEEWDLPLSKFCSISRRKMYWQNSSDTQNNVDEAIAPYFGRHGCKQYTRGMFIRCEYKLWTGTMRLGYIAHFDPGQGSSTKLPVKYNKLGLGAALFYNMTVQNSWHLHKPDGRKLDQLAFRSALLETYRRSTKRGPSKPPASLHEYSLFNRLDYQKHYQKNSSNH
ncbi:hypothetical protein ILUMI_19956 [Ignelater luminosus]|uniref:Uncharacterized protein n=1 Tax=Ignelater luminosus TaxID=2038154 RepID=A0A8K0CJ46_IGNLU|nr:hypothetical protein ILUMI_19956 [Ignelater luminosus]